MVMHCRRQWLTARTDKAKNCYTMGPKNLKRHDDVEPSLESFECASV